MGEVRTLSRSDYPSARETLTRAFHDYNLMVYAAPGDQRRLRGAAAVYGGILADAFRRGEVYALENCAGIACWLPPGCDVPNFWQQVRAGMLTIPLHFGPRGFARLVDYDNVARRLHHEHAPMPHWYLAAIGVVPERQGQGIASALMRPMLERADAEGMPCYLDTHLPQNVRLYERHGFRIAEHVGPGKHPIPVWAMFRPAGGAAT